MFIWTTRLFKFWKFSIQHSYLDYTSIRNTRVGYSNLTPDPQGARAAPGVKIQVSPNQKTSLTKVVRNDKGMIKISSAPPEELGKPAKRVS